MYVFSPNFSRRVYYLRKALVKIRIFLQLASWSPERNSQWSAGCKEPGPSRNVQAACAEPGQQVNTASDRFIFISCPRQPLNSGQVQGKPKDFTRGKEGWWRTCELRFHSQLRDPPAGGPRPSYLISLSLNSFICKIGIAGVILWGSMKAREDTYMPGSSWQEFRGREASWVSKEMASVYSGSAT